MPEIQCVFKKTRCVVDSARTSGTHVVDTGAGTCSKTQMSWEMGCAVVDPLPYRRGKRRARKRHCKGVHPTHPKGFIRSHPRSRLIGLELDLALLQEHQAVRHLDRNLDNRFLLQG